MKAPDPRNRRPLLVGEIAAPATVARGAPGSARFERGFAQRLRGAVPRRVV